MMSVPTPQNCPRWDRCSAPLCPLDPHAARRAYLPGDPLCGLPWGDVLRASGSAIRWTEAVRLHVDRGAAVPPVWRRMARPA